MNVCWLEYEVLVHGEEITVTDMHEQREKSSFHFVLLQYRKVEVTQASFSRILLGHPFPVSDFQKRQKDWNSFSGDV